MPSERSKLQENANDSKNTRMDVVSALSLMDFRKDELMHISRYLNAGQTAIDLSKQLGRPIRMLDIGCGEAYTMRTFYKSFVTKKSDVIKKYVGIDIDEPMLERTAEKYKNVLEIVNGKLIARDLTTNPKLKFKDSSIDLIIWFEMVEHIQPKFVVPILEEARRVLSENGVMLLSTPNSNGSNKVLPKDPLYEWSYEELREVIENVGFSIVSATGVCVNPSKIPTEAWDLQKDAVKAIYNSFGRGTAMSCIAMAPLFPVTYSKNMLFKCRKGEE